MNNPGAHGRAERLPLSRWLWQSYLRAAVVPLLVIELSFIGVYWVSNQVTYQRNVETVSRLSNDALDQAAQREARAIAEKLNAVTDLTRVFARQTQRALATPVTPSAAEQARHAFGRDGTFYSISDDGGAASFFSGIVPVGPPQLETVWRSAQLDPLMKSIKESNPLVAQIYLNTRESYNRIYPYFDVLTQYPAKMDIPSFNFYYEADLAHNPQRKAVWTDAYVDPAGAGWMVSSIAPVYRADSDFLEGVVGIDVTIDTIVHQVLNLRLPWEGYALLISRDGTILALPPRGEQDFGLKELTSHSYAEAIRSDTFKPDDFNIGKRADLAALTRALAAGEQGRVPIMLHGERHLASWSRIDGPDWWLVMVAPESSILAEANTLREKLTTVGWLMVAGLFIFYLGFFFYLRARARAMSARVAAPLGDIERLITRIGAGDYTQSSPDYEVAELHTVGTQLVDMGRRLGEAYAAVVEAEAAMRKALDSERRLGDMQRQFINVVSHEFRTPLTIIDGVAQTFERRAARLTPEKIVERAQSLRRAVSRLVDVMDSALNFARLEENQIERSFAPVALRELVDEVVGAQASAYPEHGFTLEDGLDVTVHGDRGLLRVALSAVCENAARYSPIGSTVRIGAAARGERVLIYVEDNGEGIPVEELEHVFERFYRGSAGLRAHGTGLGLYLAHHFLQLLGGGIRISSELGHGTRVEIELPLEPAGRNVQREAA